MRTTFVPCITLAPIIAVGLFCIVQRSSAEPPLRGADASKPAAAGVAAWDDETLGSRYLAALKTAGYPKSSTDLRKLLGDAGADRADAMRQEIENRGKQRWKQAFESKKPIDAQDASDAKLLLLLFGIPKEMAWGGVEEDYYSSVMHEVLARGDKWDKIASEWHWCGLEGLPDRRLRELWDHSQDGGCDQIEPVLNEMIRRGGVGWEKTLTEWLATDAKRQEAKEKAAGDWLAKLSAKDAKANKESPPDLLIKSGNNMAVLTALRRVQKKPDPITIRIDGPLKASLVFPALPTLDVALVNQDVEKKSVGYTVGGDYRSGRQVRWRIDVIDERENHIAERGQFFGMGGGLFNFGELGPNDKWTTSLNVASYVPALVPGKYRLRVLYHDSEPIADRDDVHGLMMCQSKEFELTIKPRAVRPDAAAVVAMQKWVASIDKDEPLKIVDGTYGKWAYGFVPPESSRGKALSMGLSAVPPLLEILDGNKLTTRQRAEVLCLLFSLTGQNDPRRAGGALLGGYEAQSGPWAIAAQGSVIGMGFSGTETSSDGSIDETKQQAFAECWRPWKKYIQVERN